MREITQYSRILFLFLFGISIQSTAQINDSMMDSVRLYKKGKKLLKIVDENLYTPPYNKNIKLAEEALILFQRINNWEGIVDAHSYISVSVYLNKNFNKAKKIALKAKNIAKNKIGVESEQYLDAFFNVTTYLDIEGFDIEAIEDYLKIIELDKESGIPKEYEAMTYHNLGTAYLEIGEYKEAIDALNNAIRIRNSIEFENENTKNENEIEVGAITSDLGDCYKRKGETKKANEFFQNSLKILSSIEEKTEYDSQIRYNCFYKLSELFLVKNDNNLAHHYAKKAIGVKDSFSVFGSSYSYQILGKLNLSQGNVDQAFIYFDQAIDSARTEADGSSNFPLLATSLTEKGNALLQLNSFDESLRTFQKGLQITALDFNEADVKKNPSLDQIIQKLNTVDLITGKAKAFLGKYKLDQNLENLKLASKHYLIATQLIQEIRKGYNTSASKHVLAGKANDVYEQAIEVCDLLYQKTNDEKHIKQAFLFAESNKSITLLESMTKETALNFSGIPDSLLKIEDSLNIKLNFATNQLAETKAQKEGKDEEIINRLEKERYELKEAYQRLIDKFEKEYPKYYQQKFAYENASVLKIQKELLDDETALVEYFLGQQFIYSFLISKNDFQLEKTERTPELVIQINELRQILSTAPESEIFTNDYKVFTQNSYELYRTLLENQISKLEDQITNLIIIPDGILGALPFDILLTEKANPENVNYSIDNLSYLLDRFAISYNYSSSLFFNKQKSNVDNSGQKFIAFAPFFGGENKVAERTCSDTELYSLKCSLEEVNKINDNFNDKVFEGLTATKDTFLNQVSEYEIIHLATHACVNEDNEMLHRIHFADDYITPYDLYNLKLNADLVVLSACNTGTGKLIEGEGVMSLSRGFIQSGATSTLMSLWSVDDCATSDMMISFYNNLSEGVSKSKALQSTKIDYINTASDKAKAHPYYWAAFVQSGDTETIKIDTKNPFWLYSLLVLGILGGVFFFRRK